MIKACSLSGEDSENLKCRCWGQTGDCRPWIQCAKSSSKPSATAALHCAESGGGTVSGLGERRSIPHAEGDGSQCLAGPVLISSAGRVAREEPAFAGAGWDAAAGAQQLGGSAGQVGGSAGCRGSDAAVAGDEVLWGDRHPPRDTGPRASGACRSHPAPRCAGVGGTAAVAGDGFSQVGGRRAVHGSLRPVAGACQNCSFAVAGSTSRVGMAPWAGSLAARSGRTLQCHGWGCWCHGKGAGLWHPCGFCGSTLWNCATSSPSHHRLSCHGTSPGRCCLYSSASCGRDGQTLGDK